MKVGVYRTVCYKVEDVFVKVLSKKKDEIEVREKVEEYRIKKGNKKNRKKEGIKKQTEELHKQETIKREKEHEEVLNLLSSVIKLGENGYTQYEYNEVETNKTFFKQLITTIYEQDEFGISFLFCEFNKTRKNEIKGYLLVTNKRILFITKSFDFQQKFRYQTVKDVQWFKDGTLERGLTIQYGTKILKFDEIFDSNQVQRIVNIITKKSPQKVTSPVE